MGAEREDLEAPFFLGLANESQAVVAGLVPARERNGFDSAVHE